MTEITITTPTDTSSHTGALTAKGTYLVVPVSKTDPVPPFTITGELKAGGGSELIPAILKTDLEGNWEYMFLTNLTGTNASLTVKMVVVGVMAGGTFTATVSGFTLS